LALLYPDRVLVSRVGPAWRFTLNGIRGLEPGLAVFHCDFIHTIRGIGAVVALFFHDNGERPAAAVCAVIGSPGNGSAAVDCRILRYAGEIEHLCFVGGNGSRGACRALVGVVHVYDARCDRIAVRAS